MPIPFIMPKMDMDQETVTIIEWLKNEGQLVQKGEPVIMIETDKITSEVESPASGRLVGIRYGNNENAPVTKVIAYILGEGETEEDLLEVSQRSEAGIMKENKQSLMNKNSKSATPVAARMAEAEKIDLSDIQADGEKITKDDVKSHLEMLGKKVETRVKNPATPAARKFASEAKIELDQIDGSGPRGRIQLEDVKMVIEKTSVEPRESKGNTIHLSNIRKRIASRLTASYQNLPHIFLNVEVDMQISVQSLKRLNVILKSSGTPSISMTAYLVRIIAWTLKRHPYLNASFSDEGIELWDDINIGVATAIDEGLIVPVINNADRLSLNILNDQLRNLTELARSDQLALKDVKGGTFTISNLGMFGIQSFTAIINPPQAAILSVGAITRKPVVVDENDTVSVRPMMMLTLGADHRVVDGAVAASFLTDLKNALETPERLLL